MYMYDLNVYDTKKKIGQFLYSNFFFHQFIKQNNSYRFLQIYGNLQIIFRGT